jgi:hypothetical protein
MGGCLYVDVESDPRGGVRNRGRHLAVSISHSHRFGVSRAFSTFVDALAGGVMVYAGGDVDRPVCIVQVTSLHCIGPHYLLV